MSPIELVSIVVAAVAVAVAAVAVMRAGRAAPGAPAAVDEQTLASYLERTNAEVASLKTQQAADAASTRASLDAAARSIEQAGNRVDGMRRDVTQQLASNVQVTTQQLQGLSQTTTEQLRLIRQDTNRQLDEMRATVDDRLTKTLNDRLSSSFKQINESLEAVYRGLGDMKSLAAGVGDLKKTLSNVKTRGILGEVQLGAMLVSSQVAELNSEGGVAEKAGAATAVAVDKVHTTVDKAKPVVSKAAAATGEAVNKGAYATGKQISKSKHMFQDFKAEYDKAVAPSDGQKKAASASKASSSSKASNAKKKVAPKKKNMFAAFKDEYDKARNGE